MVNTIMHQFLSVKVLLQNKFLGLCTQMYVVPWQQQFMEEQNIFKTFIDDFLKKIFFYTMKTKFDVFNNLRFLKLW
jgi:hypothetical protein